MVFLETLAKFKYKSLIFKAHVFFDYKSCSLYTACRLMELTVIQEFTCFPKTQGPFYASRLVNHLEMTCPRHSEQR